MSVTVKEALCRGCGICVRVCPDQAISMQAGVAIIDQAKCSLCQKCIQICPTGAIQLSEVASASKIQKQQDAAILQREGTAQIIPQQNQNSGTSLSQLCQSVLARVSNSLKTTIEQGLASLQQKRTDLSSPYANNYRREGMHRRYRAGGSRGYSGRGPHAGRRSNKHGA